jgi:hypothetical protein
MARNRSLLVFFTACFAASSSAFLFPSSINCSQKEITRKAASIDESTTTMTDETLGDDGKASPFWKIAPSTSFPEARPLTPELRKAMLENSHPEETQEELGMGLSVISDWKENWYTYESPPENPDLIDNDTGYAEYECDEIEGKVPDDLVGTLYRNGPGKFGVNEQRVQHVLDADALVYKIEFPPVEGSQKRKISFLSRFVMTAQFLEEQESQKFLYRGTFGTGPASELFDTRPKNGLNADPIEPTSLSKVFGGAFNTDIKNSANTQVIRSNQSFSVDLRYITNICFLSR